MKLSLAIVTIWLSATLAQTIPACTAEMVASDDCAAVIDANACYNKFRFSGTQTLSCILGTDNKDKARKVRRALCSRPTSGIPAMIRPANRKIDTGMQVLRLCRRCNVQMG